MTLSPPRGRPTREGRTERQIGEPALAAAIAGHPRGTLDPEWTPGPALTWANLVTWVRIGACVTCFAIAAHRNNASWNLTGLLVYWALDGLDGLLARVLHQETRMGAQLDIIADRVLIVFFYHNYLTGHPQLLLPVGLFLFQYIGLDLYLSLQFLRWPILSPNYFYLVDRRIWALNWSLAAKVGNTGLVTWVILLTGAVELATAVCLGLIAIKVYSWVCLHRLPAPERRWP